MITSISWRNIWRNPRRSLVIIIASVLGVTAGIFMLSFMLGWVEQRIHVVVHTELSSIQIHDSVFRETEDVNRFIPDATGSIERIASLDGVQAVSGRLVVNSMLKTAQENLGARINGIDPTVERSITDLPDKMTYGSWFDSERSNLMVMSERTAKKLGVIVYQLRQADLDTLEQEGMPSETLAILDTFTTAPSMLRLNEYQFDKNMRDLLGGVADKQTIQRIKEQAWHLRERISINVMVQDTSGAFHEEAFKLGGLYRTSNAMFDEMNVYVDKAELARMTGLSESDTHEIAVLLENDDELEAAKEKISEIMEGQKVETWKDLSPISKYYSESMGAYTYVFMGVILLALFFGIVNTMLMAVLERVKEIGMLKAVGMNSRKIFTMIVLESVFLTLTGSIIGIVFGMILNAIFSVHPINLSMFAEGLEGFGFDPVVYTYIGASDLIGISVLCALTGVFASIIPAIKAVKLKPVDAIRIE